MGDDFLAQEGLRVWRHIGEIIGHHKYLDNSSIWIEEGLRGRKGRKTINYILDIYMYSIHVK